MKPRLDMNGVIPKLGDTIAFNPPKCKGLVTGVITGLKKSSGLPEVKVAKDSLWETRVTRRFVYDDSNFNPTLTPKTGFVVCKPPASSVWDEAGQRVYG